MNLAELLLTLHADHTVGGSTSELGCGLITISKELSCIIHTYCTNFIGALALYSHDSYMYILFGS